jgi:hypothetical protein
LVLNDIVQDTFSSQLIKDTLSNIDDASLIQTMTSLTREIPREASLRQELSRSRRHLPDHNYGELTRRMAESGGIERLARVAAGIGSPYASQDLVTKALNTQISRATANQGLKINAKRMLTAGSGLDRFRFLKHSTILSELGMSYFQPNSRARFLGHSMPSTGSALNQRNITTSKILMTNTMSQKMTVRYRDEAGLLQQTSLFHLARTNPAARLVREDAVDQAGNLIPIGGAVPDEVLTNVTAGSLNSVRLSKVSGQDQIMFNIYMAGHGTTDEQAQILSDSLVSAARSELTELTQTLEGDELSDIDPELQRHMEESIPELTQFLASVDSSITDEEEKTSRELLVEAVKGQRNFNWNNKWRISTRYRGCGKAG